jgi:(1->4)-alpha-D-glucan 1-alpha-D-glucosylmutase
MVIPRATYRFQFNEHFRLTQANALIPYLSALGISHVYASPLFKAGAHSNHGYDVCDFSQINPEIGTEADLETLVQTLHENGMGLVLDIVPNHMGISTRANAWWWDVLKNGRTSHFASHFDINWDSNDESLHGKVLLPVLGEDCNTVLEKGELKLENRADELVLRYFENEFPVAPGSFSLDGSIDETNHNPAAFRGLLNQQHYQLASWREGDQRLNYRRFFAISTLAGVRVEEKTVFDDVHSLVRRWVGKKWLDGLRVDHPDGLYDPEHYLNDLSALAPDQWIVVEKILQPQEQLPETWPVHGTTGYDFLNQVNGLFVDSSHEKTLTDFYVKFTGESADAHAIVQEKKRLVLNTLFVTEVNRLTELLYEVAIRRFAEKRLTYDQLREALVEFTVHFSVYRTYIRPEEYFISESDTRFVRQAEASVRKARVQRPAEVFDLITGLLFSRYCGELEDDFVARFQQLTGPAMAKGVEDTTFYCLNRFASLNEVGGDPGRFGVPVNEFHDYCEQMRARWPHTMLASSTHDTKRSEDVRARLNVLSEIPDEWCTAVLRWAQRNDRHRTPCYPDRNAEYLFYQTLVGAWPISTDRILAYMEKASCEAKQETDWNDRNAEYDAALKNFIIGALTDQEFTNDLSRFVSRLKEASQINTLTQTLVKLTVPGVPDIYQGTELDDFSLVDPDNRRPVDFALRERLLTEAKDLSADVIWRRRGEGLPKLWLIQKVLRQRAQHDIFFKGNYLPLRANGDKAGHVVAFMRTGSLITIVPRFTLALKDDWANTTMPLPEGQWQNEFTDETFSGEIGIRELFKSFPVAFLIRSESK